MINKTFLGRLAISGCMALFLCISAAGTLEAAATIQEVVIENKADSSGRFLRLGTRTIYNG